VTGFATQAAWLLFFWLHRFIWRRDLRSTRGA
jgi:hypothetical protein